jgi:hypothetical protein
MIANLAQPVNGASVPARTGNAKLAARLIGKVGARIREFLEAISQL